MNESTPELEDVLQEEESEGVIEVPVRVASIGPVQTHVLPARDAIMRSVTVNDSVQQIVGGNLRRQKLTVWATSATSSGFLYIGTNKNEVESDLAARLPALVDTYVDGSPMIMEMTHTLPVWVKNTGAEIITLSFVAEDWAD